MPKKENGEGLEARLRHAALPGANRVVAAPWILALVVFAARVFSAPDWQKFFEVFRRLRPWQSIPILVILGFLILPILEQLEEIIQLILQSKET